MVILSGVTYALATYHQMSLAAQRAADLARFQKAVVEAMMLVVSYRAAKD
jgi:hypothetical protein